LVVAHDPVREVLHALRGRALLRQPGRGDLVLVPLVDGPGDHRLVALEGFARAPGLRPRWEGEEQECGACAPRRLLPIHGDTSDSSSPAEEWGSSLAMAGLERALARPACVRVPGDSPATMSGGASFKPSRGRPCRIARTA